VQHHRLRPAARPLLLPARRTDGPDEHRPIAGGVVTILLAGAVAALDSWTKMALVFLFYFIYVNIENAYLTRASCVPAST